MTEQEAIKRLETHKEWGFAEPTIEALDMAIKALERQNELERANERIAERIVERLAICAVDEPLTENGVRVGTVKVLPLSVAVQIAKEEGLE